MDSLLQVKSLSVCYQHSPPAVDNLSLSLPQSAVLVIVGESGSGKSTLLRAAIGLLSPGGRITEGRILFRDIDITDPASSSLRDLRGKQIAMIFQDAQASLNPRLKIGYQFAEILRCHLAVPATEARRMALTALRSVHMPDPARVMDAYPFELSGGMCQRVALAMAVSEYIRPALVLADEPTSSLDVTTQAQVIRQILNYRERFGAGVIMVTHNFGIAAYMADYIAVMRSGRLVEWGERDQIVLDPREEYTRKLLEAVPTMEVCH